MDEEDQVRDVYAFYGLAMYWAQCLEQSIFVHLIFLDFYPNNIKSLKNSTEWTSDFVAYEEKELGKTMGRLLQKLKDEGQPTEEVTSLLTVALQKRNWLAHSYFSQRSVELTVQNGRSQMITELQAMIEMFMQATAELDKISKPIARSYGYTEEMEAKAMVEMLAEMNSKQNP
jgi:uncharacterized protein YutE (UPF0331/DUF86 family)